MIYTCETLHGIQNSTCNSFNVVIIYEYRLLVARFWHMYTEDVYKLGTFPDYSANEPQEKCSPATSLSLMRPSRVVIQLLYVLRN